MALYQAQEMLKDAQKQDRKIGLLACYNCLYQIYDIKDLKGLATEYCLKAIELTEKYNMDNYNISFSYAEAARYFIDQNNTELAIEYLKKAESTANADIHLANVKMNFVHYYLATNNPQKAWIELQESRSMFDNNSNTTVYYKNYYDNEYYYYKMTGQYHKALEPADRQIEEELKLNEQALRNSH